MGFPSPLLPLDERAAAALGLPPDVRQARITQGAGALRGLAILIADGADFRDALTRTANSMARTASQLLWIVLALRPTSRELAIFCWRSGSHHMRIAALLCRTNHVVQSDAE